VSSDPDNIARTVSEESASWPTSSSSPDVELQAPGAELSTPPDVAAMTFEQALGELERIVQDLERGQLDLEAAIQAYERGTELKEHCRRKLQEAQLRVERITLGPDGEVRTEPMDSGSPAR
jgi:exodeoxyribonuclease VII small subunit